MLFFLCSTLSQNSSKFRHLQNLGRIKWPQLLLSVFNSLTMMKPEHHTFIFCFTALHDTSSVLYLIFTSITFAFSILDFCSDNFQGRYLYLFHPKLYYLVHSTAVFSSILKKENFFMSTLSFLINSVLFCW